MRITSLAIILAVAMLAGCSDTPEENMGAAVDNDHNVLTGGPITGTTIDALPPAVKETLRQRVPHAKIATIEKSKRDGQTVYEFNFTRPDQTPHIYVRADGAILPELTRAQQ